MRTVAQWVLISFVGVALGLAAPACGPADRPGGGGGDGGVGDDAAPACEEGEFNCFGRILQRCQGGRFEDQYECQAPTSICTNADGCVECRPGADTCVGDEVHSCSDAGVLGPVLDTCDGTAVCQNGTCQDLCGDAAENKSYLGCEYWPVDLDNAADVVADSFLGSCDLLGEGLRAVEAAVCYNPDAGFFDPPFAGFCEGGTDCSGAPVGYRTCVTRSVCILDAQTSPFAVVVSNPSDTGAAIVELTGGGITQTFTVGPREVLPLFPQAGGTPIPDQSIDGTGVTARAYHVVSNRPVVAYQFNPLDNVGVFSNDASLLLPAATLDARYYALTWPTLTRRPEAHDFHGYVAIVATGAGTTNVTVTPTAATIAGGDVPALVAGTPYVRALTQGQVLSIEAGPDGDLSGTLIEGDQPLALFAGHEATNMTATPGACCADHLEDQVFPTSVWGMSYAVARSLARGAEPDRLRILAQRDGTVVTLNPASAGTCPTLAAGAFCTLDLRADVEITATEPVLVAHYLLAIGTGGDAAGDPSMAYSVPTEQFRTSYDLLVPSQYATNYLSIVTPAGAAVTLDGSDLAGQMMPFGSGVFGGGRVTLAAGAHRLECPSGCGVEIGGYDSAVSYLLSGGLDLERISIDP